MANPSIETTDLILDAGFDTQSDFQAGSATLVNMYVVHADKAKKKTRLRRMRGIKQKGTFSGVTGERATYQLGSVGYAVVGNKFFEVSSIGATTVLGTLVTSTGHARIVANQKEPTPEILIVDGTKGYSWDGATFAQITAPNFPGKPVDCDYLDGYFIVATGESNQFGLSGINDITAWSSFDQARITTASDTLVAVGVLHRRIYFFGNILTEMWANQGQRNFPLRRDNNVALNYGCAAASSLAIGFDRMFFLSSTADGVSSIMKIVGTLPERISNDALDYAIRKYTNPSDAAGYIIKTDDGHIQYHLNFTTDNASWVWDEATEKLSQRQMLNGSRFIGNGHLYLGNKHYLIGYNNNILYEESEDYLDNNGEAVRYILRTPMLIDGEYRRVKLLRLKIDCNRGIGVPTAPYDKPVLFLRISRDGGVSYGNTIPQPLAPQGDYRWRTIYRRMGAGRDIVFEFEHVSKNNFGIFGGVLEYIVESQ